MNNPETQTKGKRDRSPSYPSIPLSTAIERLSAFDDYFKHHPAPVSKVGLAWRIKAGSSQASSTIAALKSYGLVAYQGSGNDLKAALTDEGRTYLRAQQDDIKRQVLHQSALKPNAIAKYWNEWKPIRPPNPVCLDELILKGKFSKAGAESFLKVYDATIAYAGLSESDILTRKDGSDKDENADNPEVKIGDYVQWEPSGVLQFEKPKRVRAIQKHDELDWVFIDGSNTGIPMSEVTIQQKGSDVKPPTFPEENRYSASEREWLRGPLSKETTYRLIVTGNLGPKEIGKLIKLLEAQKDVLSDDAEQEAMT